MDSDYRRSDDWMDSNFRRQDGRMDSDFRRKDVQGLLRHSHPRPDLYFEQDGVVSRPQSQLRHSRGKLAPYLIRGWNPSYSRHLLRHSRESGNPSFLGNRPSISANPLYWTQRAIRYYQTPPARRSAPSTMTIRTTLEPRRNAVSNESATRVLSVSPPRFTSRSTTISIVCCL